jgi:hypothetical protein
MEERCLSLDLQKDTSSGEPPPRSQWACVGLLRVSGIVAIVVVIAAATVSAIFSPSPAGGLFTLGTTAVHFHLGNYATPFWNATFHPRHSPRAGGRSTSRYAARPLCIADLNTRIRDWRGLISPPQD